MITVLAFLIWSASSGADTTILGRLAKAYDYQSLRDVRLKTTTGSFQFRSGKLLDLAVASPYELFPEDTAYYRISETQFTRKVMPDAKTDVGVVPGVLDFAGLFRQVGVTAQLDSSHPGQARVFLPDIHNAWFSIGQMPVIPFRDVEVELLVNVRSLEISEIRAQVNTPGGMPEYETYVMTLGQYRTVQGRLVPGVVTYSIEGLGSRMNDRSMELVQHQSMTNRAYRDSIVAKVRGLERSGQKEKASRYKRAAVRVRSLKAQIAEGLVTTGKPIEVKLIAVSPTVKSGSH